MEVSSASIQPSCSFPLRAPKTATRDRVSSLYFLGNSACNVNFSPLICKGYRLLARSVRLQRFFVSASVIDDKAVTPSHYSVEQESVSDFCDSFDSSLNQQPTSTENGEGSDNVGQLDNQKMVKVCDKLIDVFMVDKPTPTDWRRLIAFSKEWENIQPHFFNRCQYRADCEDDPEMKHKLLRLRRKFKEVDEDVQRHNELLKEIKEVPSKISEIVARRRKDFTKEFFVHLHTVAQSYYDDPIEQNALSKLGNTCLAVVQAYDNATESAEALNAAELKLQDIINSPSLDAACRKIDNLAEKNQLDSALVLMISKAWSAAKESNMTKDEVKDILYHLYTTSVGNLQRLVPKEIRILKYLLKIEDPEERLSALDDAFTPGEELEGKDFDCLYTTPEKLHTWITTIVDAYHFSGEGTLLREAKDLMNPKIIHKLEELKKVVENKFM